MESFFFLDKVATRDNLCDMGVNLGNKMCLMCDLTYETSSHLFFSCQVASRIYNMCNIWIGIKITHHNQLVQHALVQYSISEKER